MRRLRPDGAKWHLICLPGFEKKKKKKKILILENYTNVYHHSSIHQAPYLTCHSNPSPLPFLEKKKREEFSRIKYANSETYEKQKKCIKMKR